MSATDRRPDWDIEVTDGSTTVKGNICNYAGFTGGRHRKNFKTTQQQRSALKMQQGGTEYSDYEFPYRSIEQKDFSGGRGLDNLNQDATRFFGSYRAETWNEGYIINGPEENYATGIRTATDEVWWDANTERTFISTRILAHSRKFVASATYTPAFAQALVGYEDPGKLDQINQEYWINSDNAGKPGTALFKGLLTAVTSNNFAQIITFPLTDLSPTTQLTSGQTYHFCIYTIVVS